LFELIFPYWYKLQITPDAIITLLTGGQVLTFSKSFWAYWEHLEHVPKRRTVIWGQPGASSMTLKFDHTWISYVACVYWINLELNGGCLCVVSELSTSCLSSTIDFQLSMVCYLIITTVTGTHWKSSCYLLCEVSTLSRLCWQLTSTVAESCHQWVGGSLESKHFCMPHPHAWQKPPSIWYVERQFCAGDL